MVRQLSPAAGQARSAGGRALSLPLPLPLPLTLTRSSLQQCRRPSPNPNPNPNPKQVKPAAVPAAVQASAAALAKVLKAEGLDELPGALIRDHCGPGAAVQLVTAQPMTSGNLKVELLASGALALSAVDTGKLLLP